MSGKDLYVLLVYVWYYVHTFMQQYNCEWAYVARGLMDAPLICRQQTTETLLYKYIDTKARQASSNLFLNEIT